MGKRLNDTAAVVGMVPYQSQEEHYSRNVRKIDNGFVVREHCYGANSPTSKEYFMENHPDSDKREGVVGGNSGAMSRAVEYMKK